MLNSRPCSFSACQGRGSGVMPKGKEEERREERDLRQGDGGGGELAAGMPAEPVNPQQSLHSSRLSIFPHRKGPFISLQ